MPVQGNAFTAKSATVEASAQVADNAKVLHYAVVRGVSRVLGDAVVEHHARLLAGDGAQGLIYVHGTAQVGGNAIVGAGADIATRRHLLAVTGLGPDSHTLTLYRTHPERGADGTWVWGARLHLSGWFGTPDAMQTRLAHEFTAVGWTKAMVWELDDLLEMADTRVQEWQREPVDNADRRRWQLRDSDLRRAAVRATRGGRIPTPTEG